MKKLLFAAIVLLTLTAKSQKTLPEFSVTTRGTGKTIISWNNAYPVITQISIQRSYDSLKNYKTILTVPDPHIPQNGFVDTKAPTNFQFYRLFIVLDSGKYIFTKPHRPVWDTARVVTVPSPQAKDEVARVINEPSKNTDTISTIEKEKAKESDNTKMNPKENVKQKEVVKLPPPPPPVRTLFVKKRDSLVMTFTEPFLKSFRDSILNKTKDTLVFRSGDTLLIKPFVPKEVYKPSIYVFTTKDGNVTISLPDVTQKNYMVKFFEEDATPLFELKEVKESPLTLDKANFVHGGWFRFELYENGQLKEKHKFFISKDF